ncbi:predicted protein [Sclerotinia sclerotiorum 1980 UF-70]|uniref:Uncharacterized protein n=1 Tax=Sclerotinia sclerotiorum (strain ATCC 18683 / 1980 / Ss-1) TaxID=665079 RepID=A7EBR2_SCLS1|nr:predicted protein [Sclerotinia sclerotiorum 1980 UF-70]EDN99890.1 predicted protein [Sclerotinia sclerotiorum 1980 UF-70]
MDLRSDIPEVHEEHPSKKQKFTEIKNDDFENKLTVPIALELGQESRDLECKLSSLQCGRKETQTKMAPQSNSCKNVSPRPNAILPSQQNASVNVVSTPMEISNHLPLSPGVRHDLACHFRVFREILSRIFSVEIQDLRRRMAKVKVESIHTLEEEMLRLQGGVKTSKDQLNELEMELKRTFETMVMIGVDISEAENDSSNTCGESMPTLVLLEKTDNSSAELLEEEIKRLKSENIRLGEKVQKLEEESVDFKTYGFQSVPIKFFTSDPKLDPQ